VNPDLLSQIDIAPNAKLVHYDFCEHIPGSIAGRVHADLDGDCAFTPGDIPLAGVQIDLFDDQGHVIATTLTDANGEYKFSNLQPGMYGVFEHQPTAYLDDDDMLGSAGGVISANDTMTQIDLNPSVDAVEYDFCEVPPA